MKTRKTEIRFFTIADHEKEQEYLSGMHRKGWKLVRVGLLCFYHFEACEPENVVYQLDYYQEQKLDREEYLGMFRDCGWEYLFDFMGYHYFRKPEAGMEGHEEIFCDDESRLDMWRRVFKGRVVWLLLMFIAAVLPNFIMNTVEYVEGRSYVKGFLVFWSVMFLLYALVLFRFAWKYFVFKRKVLG